jgi:hypothetical protein
MGASLANYAISVVCIPRYRQNSCELDTPGHMWYGNCKRSRGLLLRANRPARLSVCRHVVTVSTRLEPGSAVVSAAISR